MVLYQTKTNKSKEKKYVSIRKEAMVLFNRIKNKTKRRPYIRSAYFSKQKIFFDYFWKHLLEKSYKERIERLQYFGASLELIRKSKNHPISIDNPHKKSEILHRFAGLTRDRELFYVQIKENKRSKRKYFMSCFSEK